MSQRRPFSVGKASGATIVTTMAASLAALLLFPAPASAHALVAREDLPIPDWLFAWGASVVLIVSFVALSYAWRTPRLEGDSWRPVSDRVSGLIVNRGTELLAGAIGVFLFAVVIWAGLRGTEAPDRNFSVTFVFVTFWLGMVGLSVLFGDVFRAFNPWRAIARTVSAGFRLVAGQDAPAPLRYPDWLGRWPAVIGLLAFIWFELIYGASLLAIGLNPHNLAVAVLAYSAFTFAGMALYGVDRWLERAEFFSVYLNMFSLLSPIEVRDGRLGKRRVFSGAGRGWADVPGSVALVIASIAATSFDGGSEGAFASAILDVFDWFKDAGLGATAAYRASNTIFLLLVVAGVAAIYALGTQGMKTVDRSRSASQLRKAFAHSLIPIALAYLVAHYFSLFVFQVQAQFTFLVSDPLGTGHDFFGTASSGVDYGVIGSEGIWYTQVAALVIGHVVGLVLAHDRAIALYEDPQTATRSQYWMLSVMVAFTCFGLYLLSQANA